MHSQLSPLCIKCQREIGTHPHYFWQRKFISRFWSLIAQELNGIFQVKVKKDRGLFILALPSEDLTLPRLHFKHILLHWIKDKPPTATLWYREIFRVLAHERISAVLKGNERSFTRKWSPLLDYLPEDLKELVFLTIDSHCSRVVYMRPVYSLFIHLFLHAHTLCWCLFLYGEKDREWEGGGADWRPLGQEFSLM